MAWLGWLLLANLVCAALVAIYLIGKLIVIGVLKVWNWICEKIRKGV